MENLTRKERIALMAILRMAFDDTLDKELELQIIQISIKLGLNPDFIKEMLSDLKV